jgi:hypothetical protein
MRGIGAHWNVEAILGAQVVTRYERMHVELLWRGFLGKTRSTSRIGRLCEGSVEWELEKVDQRRS